MVAAYTTPDTVLAMARDFCALGDGNGDGDGSDMKLLQIAYSDGVHNHVCLNGRPERELAAAVEKMGISGYASSQIPISRLRFDGDLESAHLEISLNP